MVEITKHSAMTVTMVASRFAGSSKLDLVPAGGLPAGAFRSSCFFAEANVVFDGSIVVLMTNDWSCA